MVAIHSALGGTACIRNTVAKLQLSAPLVKPLQGKKGDSVAESGLFWPVLHVLSMGG